MRPVRLSAEEISFIRQLARTVVDNLGRKTSTQSKNRSKTPQTN